MRYKHFFSRHQLFPLALIFLIFGSGCTTHQPARHQAAAQLLPLTNGAEILNGSVKIVKIDSSRPFRTRIHFRNQTRKPVSFAYRIRFFSKNGDEWVPFEARTGRVRIVPDAETTIDFAVPARASLPRLELLPNLQQEVGRSTAPPLSGRLFLSKAQAKSLRFVANPELTPRLLESRTYPDAPMVIAWYRRRDGYLAASCEIYINEQQKALDKGAYFGQRQMDTTRTRMRHNLTAVVDGPAEILYSQRNSRYLRLTTTREKTTQPDPDTIRLEFQALLAFPGSNVFFGNCAAIPNPVMARLVSGEATAALEVRDPGGELLFESALPVKQAPLVVDMSVAQTKRDIPTPVIVTSSRDILLFAFIEPPLENVTGPSTVSWEIARDSPTQVAKVKSRIEGISGIPYMAEAIIDDPLASPWQRTGDLAQGAEAVDRLDHNQATAAFLLPEKKAALIKTVNLNGKKTHDFKISSTTGGRGNSWITFGLGAEAAVWGPNLIEMISEGRTEKTYVCFVPNHIRQLPDPASGQPVRVVTLPIESSTNWQTFEEMDIEIDYTKK